MTSMPIACLIFNTSGHRASKQDEDNTHSLNEESECTKIMPMIPHSEVFLRNHTS